MKPSESRKNANIRRKDLPRNSKKLSETSNLNKYAASAKQINKMNTSAIPKRYLNDGILFIKVLCPQKSGR
jgi:hypothetical protein